MTGSFIIDDKLLSRLPLPLAQLYRRAHNAKSPRDRRDFAYYIWEAAIKLLASTALVAYAEQPDDDEVNRKLPSMDAPSMGQWKDLVLLLAPALARRGDEAFQKIEGLLTKSRDDLPRCTHLQSTILSLLNQQGAGRTTICIAEFLRTLVEYRNKEFSHGAPASRGDTAISQQANALAAAAVELFDRLDVLASRRLVAITDVSLSDGSVRAARVNLVGLNPWQFEPMEWTLDDRSARPMDIGVYLADPQHFNDPAGLRSLHPLVVFDPVGESVLLYNGRSGRNNAMHLCYVTNRMPKQSLTNSVHRDLLAKLLDVPVAMRDADAPAVKPKTMETTDKPLGPRFIGDYELKRELGRGAMGVVHEAWQPVLRRRVALKEQPRSHDPLADKRFLREIAALGRVEHPNLIKVFTSGSEGGCLYYTMELVDGEPLSAVSDALTRGGAAATIANEISQPERVEQSREPSAASGKVDDSEYVRRMVELVRQAAEAAHALHEAGVLHRDIKPSNIMVTADGKRAVLMDLGTARMTNETSTLTKQFLGTLRYASVEQLRGMTLDARSDVYSLGATLWELLALKPMFQVSEQTPTPDLIHKLETEEPERLTRLNPVVPRDLESVVHKCLEKKPERRYGTAQEFADDLGRWLQNGSVRAPPVSKIDRTIKWIKRHPAIAALYGAIAALIVLMIGSIIVYQRQQIVHAGQERRTRAAASVDALKTSDIAGVPIIIRGMESVRDEADPILSECYEASPKDSRLRLRYALAWLPANPALADEVLDFVKSADAEEVLVLREMLKPYRQKVLDYWPNIADDRGKVSMSVAGLEAEFEPEDSRWKNYVDSIAGQMVQLNPIELRAWFTVFDPIHKVLTPPLVKQYVQLQKTAKTSNIQTRDLILAAAGLDMANAVLERYAADQPEVLADLLQIVDSRHFAAIFAVAQPHQAVIIRELQAGIERTPDPNARDDEIESLAIRHANAAIALTRFGQREPAWKMLRHSADPTARSYLIHGAAPRAVDAIELINRYDKEPDVSARRALLLALGEFGDNPTPPPEFVQRLLSEFRHHPDAGLHGAIDWLLRQKWGKKDELNRITLELRGPPHEERQWFVSPGGQTFTVFRGPVEFTIGSPLSEPGREEGPIESQHAARIERSFAFSAREVTVAEFTRFLTPAKFRKQYSPYPDSPMSDINWYEALAYCRWLSELEGVPEDQMCYPPLKDIKPGVQLPPDFLERTGYRLPTNAEWEYACRAGAVTSRPYGRGTELLGYYAWYQLNSEDNARLRHYPWYQLNFNDHAWPVGLLKPNDFGLFDMLGNGGEWCHDRHAAMGDASYGKPYVRPMPFDPLVARSGAWYFGARSARSATQFSIPPFMNLNMLGMRVVRTVK